MRSVHDHYEDQKEESQEDDDDLLMFEEQRRIQIIKSNNLNMPIFDVDSPSNKKNKKSGLDDMGDFNRFYSNQEQEIHQEINKKENQKDQSQVNEEELSAKKLRAFNAAKYFQKIKIAFIKQVYNCTREIDELFNDQNEAFDRNSDSFNTFLSLLPDDLLDQCIDLKNKSPFTIGYAQVLSLFKQVFTNSLLESYFSLQPESQLTKSQLIFMLSHFVNCKVKKVEYFNVQSFVDESFYNLNFSRMENGKRKSKKTSKLQDQLSNQIQRRVLEQSLQDEHEFVDLNNFCFDTVSQNMKKSGDQLSEELKASKTRSRMTQEIKRCFLDQTYQIFSYEQNKWKLFTSVEGQFQQLELDWFKQQILAGLPIVAFFSLENLSPLHQFKALFNLRKMGTIAIKDASMYFCDDWKKIAARRRRLGVRSIINKIYRFCNFLKPFDLLQPFEAFQFEHTLNQTKKILIEAQLPKTNMDFKFSDYFLTPSRVGKYHLLSPEAKPVSNEAEFNDQKIFWKDDLVPVCSRMGWIDFSRMVRDHEEPLKKTQNRNKKPIELYRYEQTKPFQLQIEPDGSFVLDPEHNSIYVPPDLAIPDDTCIVAEKITYICNKHKFKYAKLVQGFINTGGMRVLPNEIGFIVYKKDLDQILKLHQERQEMLNSKKESRMDERIERMWREILKFVKLTEKMSGNFN